MKSDAVKRGLERAPHRSLLWALGLTDEEMERPFVGVISSYNEIVPGHMHLRTIAEAVKSGVYMAGGTPFEANTIAVCDGIAMGHMGMKYSLASRELIADSVETVAQAHAFDALVLIPSCDKIIPGMVMAAARLNLPTVIVTGGPMLAGRRGADVLDLNSAFMAVGAATAGTMSRGARCERIEKACCPGCGSCSGMFTANTMACLCEALGIALPGNGTTPAVSSRRMALARQAGMQVMEMLEQQHLRARYPDARRLPQRLFDRHGHGRLDQLGAAPAGHRPRGRRVDDPARSLNDYSQTARRTCASSRRPATQHIEDLYYSGGIGAIMHELEELGLLQARRH